MDILKQRTKIVKINKLFFQIGKLLSEINDDYLKEYQKQQGFVGVGNGYKIPPLTKTDKSNPHQPSDCCGDEADDMDYR